MTNDEIIDDLKWKNKNMLKFIFVSMVFVFLLFAILDTGRVYHKLNPVMPEIVKPVQVCYAHSVPESMMANVDFDGMQITF